jgi:hypothetical protein
MLKTLRRDNRTSKVEVRLTKRERALLQASADTYTDGNLSEWIRYASFKHVPHHDEIEECNDDTCSQ